jgi:hypothetical protein
MDIDDAYPSRNINAASLRLHGGSMTSRIVDIDYDRVGTDEERKLILVLEGGKRFILNKTNARSIAGFFGRNTDDWKNKEIELYVTPVDLKGRMVDGVRVRLPQRNQTQVSARSPKFVGKDRVEPEAKLQKSKDSAPDDTSIDEAPNDDIPF